MWAESDLTSLGFRKRGFGFGGLNLLYTISVRDLRLIRITSTSASVSKNFRESSKTDNKRQKSPAIYLKSLNFKVGKTIWGFISKKSLPIFYSQKFSEKIGD